MLKLVVCTISGVVTSVLWMASQVSKRVLLCADDHHHCLFMTAFYILGHTHFIEWLIWKNFSALPVALQLKVPVLELHPRSRDSSKAVQAGSSIEKQLDTLITKLSVNRVDSKVLPRRC